MMKTFRKKINFLTPSSTPLASDTKKSNRIIEGGKTIRSIFH